MRIADVKLRLALALTLTLASFALAACLGNSGSPTAPPSNVQAYAGDAAVSVTWDENPDISYWLFYAQDPSVTPYDLDSGTTALLNFGYVVPAFSPIILCNSYLHTVINQSLSASSNYPAFYFTINGRTGTAKGGPGSAPVSAMPRPSGARVPWVSGSGIPTSTSGNAVNGMGYIALTGCGYAGHPPEGIFVAVGPNSAIYTSTLAPSVAGPLTNPGNQAMTWTQSVTPAGFSGNLNAVAGRASSLNNPSGPGLLVVAVGDGGAILYSDDAINWHQSGVGVTTNNLHDIAYASGAFVAVGDSGTILTSGDGVNWSVNQSALTANASQYALRSVRCQGSQCVAVGDSGTTMFSSNNGGTWSLLPFGTNNWVAVAYGNQDANSDQAYSAATVTTASGITVNGSFSASSEPINTWVVVDANGDYGYYNSNTNGAWTAGPSIIAPNIVAIDYTTHFIALDSAGNAWYSEQGTTGAWATYSSAPVASGGATAIALRANGQGFVAMGNTGLNAASF